MADNEKGAAYTAPIFSTPAPVPDESNALGHYTITDRAGYRRDPCECSAWYADGCYCLPDDRAVGIALRDLLRESRESDRQDFFLEGFDTVRIAFAWLDAQPTLPKASRHKRALKHVIEAWGQRYVPTPAVQIAARIHPRITGNYPRFNLGRDLVYPDPRRLEGIRQAFIHPSTSRHGEPDVYAGREVVADQGRGGGHG